MEETTPYTAFESSDLLHEEDNNGGGSINTNSSSNGGGSNHGWQKVVYAKRQRKPTSSSANPENFYGNGVVGSGNKTNVFRSVEKEAEERRRRVVEAQKAAAAADFESVVPRRKQHSEDDDESDDVEGGGGDGVAVVEVKKPKEKKPKKPKVTVAEAASKIDALELASHLADVMVQYEGKEEIQLMRFADFFASRFSAVAASQFPWTKMFKESTVAKIADIPLSYISEDVYKTSVDWINQRSVEALGSFVLWLLDSILADLASQSGASKGSKKAAQPVSSKSQVAIFVALAMTLRRKPDVLINLLPKLREDKKYQGQDKLPVIVWVISQASQGDLAVGMYSCIYNLLPVLSAKSCNPQSRDLILQLVERILSSPKARPVLLNGAVRKGERLVPPPALDMLMRLTFPASSARIKATERFEAVYPVLKEVALAGAPGSKAMKQATQQIFSFALEAAGESAPELSKEAASICIWCLTQCPDTYKQWDKLYLDNVEASVAVLRKLSSEWKEHSAKQASLEPLREALKSFRLKNEKELVSGEKHASHQASIREADKYCKVILGKSARSHACLKSMVFIVAAAAVGAYYVNPDLESWNLNELIVKVSNPGTW